jgi:P4 family phage/plasmid primase-like protien
MLDPRDPMRAARALVAARFVNDGHRLLHRHRGTFWRFQSNHYALADQESVRAEVWRFLEAAQRQDSKGKPVPFKPNRARVSDVLDALGAACKLDSSIEPPAWLNGVDELPAATEMLPLANGLLHLPSGELYPAMPSFFGLAASDVAFDPDAPDPQHWLAFLGDLFEADVQAIAALQDWFGYALSPDTSQHKILFVVGPRRSGKGTIARVLTALAGRDSVANPTLASLQTPFGLAPLIGKPLAFITDARLGGRSDQAAITERLLSISGEDALTIDRKHIDAWTGRLPTRFVILTNELPRIADTSGALVGRLVTLVLVHSFYGREDPGLTARLLTELPGILNWALHGYRRLRQRGYFVQTRQRARGYRTTRNARVAHQGVYRGALQRQARTLGPGRTALSDLARVVRRRRSQGIRHQADIRTRPQNRRAELANYTATGPRRPSSRIRGHRAERRWRAMKAERVAQVHWSKSVHCRSMRSLGLLANARRHAASIRSQFLSHSARFLASCTGFSLCSTSSKIRGPM